MLLNAHVEGAEWDGAQWAVRTRTCELASDFVVVALPFEAAAQLLPHLPVAEGAEELTRQIGKQVHWPLCSVHLWFDREITELEHAVLLDREIHWMYNQSRLQTGRGGYYIELVVSASRVFAALPREQAIRQAVAELAEFFPRVKEAKLEKFALVKEVRAESLSRRGLDRDRLAFDDGERGAIGASGGRGGLRKPWGAAKHSQFGFAAARANAVDARLKTQRPCSGANCPNQYTNAAV